MKHRLLIYAEIEPNTGQPAWCYRIYVGRRFFIQTLTPYDTKRGAKRAALNTLRQLGLKPEAQQVAL